jgi:protein tyrosine/serine phosphatase
MVRTARLCLIILLLDNFCAAESVRVRPGNWAQPVLGSSLENFYRVSDDLYRSEQPQASDLPGLKALGIKTVFSLRHYHHDSRDFERAGIHAEQYPMDAGSVSVAELVIVLRTMRTAPKPILLHCWHGSDRTGFVVAGYRMIFMNWTAAEAIEELRLGGFGHHASYYPNIAKVLKELDVAAVRNAVLNPPRPAP